MKSGCTAIAYETVTNARGGLPLLAPMSEVAGRMSIQVGAHCLEKAAGGSGMLLGGVPGVPPGERRRSSAAASPAPMPRAWPWAWRPTSPSSTSRSTG